LLVPSQHRFLYGWASAWQAQRVFGKRAIITNHAGKFVAVLFIQFSVWWYRVLWLAIWCITKK
jgi:hypothetical protein